MIKLESMHKEVTARSEEDGYSYGITLSFDKEWGMWEASASFRASGAQHERQALELLKGALERAIKALEGPIEIDP